MPFAYADLLKTPESFHCEIFGGRLVISAARTPAHQRVLGNIAFSLDEYVAQRELGTVLIGPVDVVLAMFFMCGRRVRASSRS